MQNNEKLKGEKEADCDGKSLGTAKEESTKACPWCGAIRSDDCCGLHPEAMAAADQAADVAQKAWSSKTKGLEGLPMWLQTINFLVLQKRVGGGREKM